MATSRVMPSVSSASSDLGPQSPLYQQPGKGVGGVLGSMNMDELLRNLYGDQAAGIEIQPLDEEKNSGAGGEMSGKTRDDVWREIAPDRKVADVGGGVGPSGGYAAAMTLEDFLAMDGAGVKEGIGVQTQQQGSVEGSMMGLVTESVLGDHQYASPPPPLQQQAMRAAEGPFLGFGNGVFDGGVVGGAGGRGKRKAVREEQVDKVTEQRQRRMIKNRESAARSRERKQAYTVELEGMVTKLEEENLRLKAQLEEQRQKRLQQLMETLIPVTERRRPPRQLVRTLSL